MLAFRTAPPVKRLLFTIDSPPGSVFTTGSGATPWPITSQDGTRLAFGAVDDQGVERLWVRELATAATRPLAGTENAEQPFWSQDGRAIGFLAKGTLKRVDPVTGAVQTIGEVPGVPRKGSWSRDGVIIYAAGGQPLHRISATGGSPEPLTSLDGARHDKAHLYPSFLPDGRHFVFMAEAANTEQSTVMAGSLDSKDVTPVLQVHSEAQYAAPGYLLFVRDGALMAQPFDPRRLRLSGEPTLVAPSVSYTTASGIAAFATAPGLLVYRPGGSRAAQAALVWRDRSGKILQRIGEPGPYADPELSPDGRHVALERIAESTSNIWVVDLTRGTASRLTFGKGMDLLPVWSDDGARIAWASNRDAAGRFNIQRVVSGSSSESLLVKDALPREWLPDGTLLCATSDSLNTGGGAGVTTLSRCGLDGRQPEAVLRFESGARHMQLSPDGRWLASVSEESGRAEVYVRRYPTGADRVQVSTGGGLQPRWRRDGRELFYLTPGGSQGRGDKLTAVSVTSGAGLDVGPPALVFEVPAAINRRATIRPEYVTTDGQRFLFIEPVSDAAGGLTLVVNWAEALNTRR